MNNENLEKDLECVGSFSVPPPSFQDRALGIAARAGRVMIRIGKVGLVLVVVATAAVTWGNREWTEDLNRQVDFLLKVATSPDRSWVAREVAVKGGKDLVPGRTVPTDKFVCGRSGSIPKECTPDPYVARTTELCIFPVVPGKFEMPRLCPESILHPEK
ncbi:hypothetical protein [Leptospirillum ferriphilum]|uniref:Uncharacterized protein n=1 Tax=Leptospirillum ferriphilum (strain ML-04) TaxID=1048260 RepID=J9ZBJ3_LEPFM|nr:hypothetical protein [Leptospirillum ferriphilum]AFS53880.1 hypothetical protein LFML04_1678 [Leptospirillum ferriphilum ML-04]